MEIKKIGVVGAGVMGSGIAQVAAQAGFEVILEDVEDRFVQGGMERTKKNLKRDVDKGVATQEKADIVLSRIKGTTSLTEVGKESDIVIDAIVENMDAKKQLFAELDKICPEHTILASNTSSLSITEAASSTNRADKFIGMHFFNPAPVMKLVEVVRGHSTSQQTFEVVKALAEKMDKVPVEVREAPGFVVNRLLIPMINEAANILMEGIASAQDIDTAMRLGANHPMGPLALGDLIGLDVTLAIMEILYKEFGDSKYRPSLLLRKVVRDNCLGRKTGKGFFEYAGR